MARVVVLGAGLVGSVMAADLAGDDDLDVTIADRDEAALARAAARCGGGVETICADLGDVDTLKRTVEPFDMVVGALASPIGLQSLRAVVDAGKKFCDICFMPENALQVHDLAVERDVTAVFDMGVAPGMSNLLAGYAAHQMDRCDAIEIYVGGLPVKRVWPFEYKAGFSPFDVIEEYTRPARLVEGGEVVTREALSEPEIMTLPDVGEVEAFNTDGLRSLIDTMPGVPDMKEKTLRYPGHIELMRVFRETGLFGHEPIVAGGVSVKPIDVISKLMFPKWTYEEGEADLTVMRVLARGEMDRRECVMQWDLYDEYDPRTGFSSMARTTGFPCAIMARWILKGRIKTAGVFAPEQLAGETGLIDDMFDELAQRGVRYHSKGV